MAMYAYIGLCRVVYDYACLCRSMQACVVLCRLVYGYVGL